MLQLVNSLALLRASLGHYAVQHLLLLLTCGCPFAVC